MSRQAVSGVSPPTRKRRFAKGQVVGNYDSAPEGFEVHGFLRDVDGTITTIDFETVPYGGTYITGIDSKGRVVGNSRDNAGLPHGFIRQMDGTFTSIDSLLHATSSLVESISPKGEVVGNYGTSGGKLEAFIIDLD